MDVVALRERLVSVDGQRLDDDDYLMGLQFLYKTRVDSNEGLFSLRVEVQHNFVEDHFIWLAGLVKLHVVVLRRGHELRIVRRYKKINYF